jgi:uncharacterized protein YgbK (DUF1537 family)
MNFNIPLITLVFLDTIVLPAIFSAAAIVFVWSLFLRYIKGVYEEETKEHSKTMMFWSVLALVTMMAIWTIAQITLGRYSNA